MKQAASNTVDFTGSTKVLNSDKTGRDIYLLLKLTLPFQVEAHPAGYPYGPETK